jgi:hypothetical protein
MLASVLFTTYARRFPCRETAGAEAKSVAKAILWGLASADADTRQRPMFTQSPDENTMSFPSGFQAVPKFS